MTIIGNFGASVPLASQSARTALALLTPRADAVAKDTTAQSQPGAVGQRESSMETLLRYAKVAKSLSSAQRPQAEVLPQATGGGTDAQGYQRSEVLTLDQLEPEYAREFGALGATQVVRLSPPALSDAEFQAQISAALDKMYADDPGYQSAKAGGAVLIQRMSEVEAEVPGFRHSWSSFALYRGNSHIGSAGMGVPSPAFDRFWADQNAAGTYVMPGMSDGTSFVARWPMG